MAVLSSEALVPMIFAYKLMDLGGLDNRALETTLNHFGAGGWELVEVLPPQTAVFKRAARAPEQPTHKERSQPIATKYRDPETGQSWSGRGRMANWLAERIKAGARLEDFLV